MHAETWKVGKLSELTHLSVRTLHYYEEIGLLMPSERTKAGHRLYTEADVERLQRILSLRQLGLTLGDIQKALDSTDYSLLPVLDLHLAKLTEQITLQRRLHRRLSALRAQLSDGERIPATEFLQTMGEITMIDQYLTPSQIQVLESLSEKYRTDHGTDAMQGFKTFVDAMKVHFKAGAAPTSSAVQALVGAQIATARGSREEDRDLGEALGQMLREQANLRKRYGLDDELISYLEQAMAYAQAHHNE